MSVRNAFSTVVRLGALGGFVYLVWHAVKDTQNGMATSTVPSEKVLPGVHRLNVAINNIDSKHFYDTLKYIAVPRVVGTPTHKLVKEHIKNELEQLGWNVTVDTFEDRTPIFGQLQFENIIARLNPHASKVVVLSCHYDSKYFPNDEFVGAIDSAVPCSMLLNVAHCLQKEMEPLRSTDTSLELWFFDGEEAFEEWGPKDSLYGARHLAKKMEQENTLKQIKSLVLLDLLGTARPSIYNYYSERDVFSSFVRAENSLESKGLLKGLSDSTSPNHLRYFTDYNAPHFVEDDHTPFLQRGVPVVHIIPVHFPKVWHTPQDNLDALDYPTIEDLNKILRLFVMDFFNLQ